MNNPRQASIRTEALIVCTVLVLGVAGCSISGGRHVGETRTISQTVPLGQAKSVKVEIKMGAGELRLSGGGGNLMDGDFTYNVDAWKPEIHYDSSGGQGTLSIEQPSGVHNYQGRTRYDWDIRLNNQVPMAMDIKMGAGKALLNLAGLNANRLSLKMGAGEADIDLDGAWQHDFSASIQGGVGKLTLHLPADVGVRARVEGGLGAIRVNDFTKEGDAYTNSAYGKSKVNLKLDIQGGLGEVNLMLGGGGTV